MSDFEEAIDRLIAGLEKKRVMSQKEREIVAYHESGHAIVATLIPDMDPVHKISIVQRGFGALGYTMQLPLEDRYLMQRRDLLNQLAVLLGGRTAEEIALSEISTGAQNDLQRATDIARAMVTEWGMSDALGAINYDGHKRNKFLDIPIGPERGAYAEDTARLIDSEVKRIMTDAHSEARRILTGHRDDARGGDAPTARAGSHGRRRTALDSQHAAGRGRRSRRKTPRCRQAFSERLRLRQAGPCLRRGADRRADRRGASPASSRRAASPRPSAAAAGAAAGCREH